jgi:uncharacterized RDD family membrane protein YckC
VTDQPPPPEGFVPSAAELPVPDVPAIPDVPVVADVPAQVAEAAAVPAEVPAAVPVAPPPAEVVTPVAAAVAAPVAAVYAAPPPLQQPAAWSGYQAPPPGPVAGGGPAAGWQYAGFWIRAVAWIIDGFILGIISTFFSFVVLVVAAGIGVGTAATGTLNADGTLTSDQAAVLGVTAVVAFLVISLALFAITVLYFVLLWVKRGATIGQSVLGLRVARERDGGPIGWGAAIVRYIVLMIGFSIFYLGVIWVAFEPRKRGWADLVAGTLVVKRG